jgi:beta-phosphoglucomutase family hydrolase
MTSVIFDMDGVLVDNAEFHRRAFAEYFSSFGIKFETGMFGRGNTELLRELFPNEKSDEKLAAYANGKEAYYRKIYAPHIRPLKGLTEFLEELQNREIPIALGSSAPDDNIDFTIDSLNLRKYFSVIVGSRMVRLAKPAPDIYLKAAELLKVEPSECVVFEDAIVGIEAARTAGMKVAGVATSLPPEELQHTDLIIKDFTEINPAMILEIAKR